MIMCLNSEQVSGDGVDWSQGMLKSVGVEIPRPAAPAQPVRQPPQKQRQQPAQQQRQGPQLRCPRCDSTNTKFCYYNNYSRTQPRHFCKACRRHWTEGGTLRNVPVGGGRKAKRPKTSHPASAADSLAGGRQGSRVDSGSTTMPASTQPTPLLPPPSFAPDILSSALLQPSLAPPTYANSSYHLGSLLCLPSSPQFVGAASAGVVDAGGYPFSASPTFPSFLNLTGQEDLPAIGPDTALTTGRSTATPPLWDLPPPRARSGGPSGSSVTTTTSSGLTALESSSPSSGYWGNCWDDLTGYLSTDLEHPPAPDPRPLHQYYFDLS